MQLIEEAFEFVFNMGPVLGEIRRWSTENASYFSSIPSEIWYKQKKVHEFPECSEALDFKETIVNLGRVLDKQTLRNFIQSYTRGVRQVSRSNRRFKCLEYTARSESFRSVYSDFTYPAISQWADKVAVIRECSTGYYACKPRDVLAWVRQVGFRNLHLVEVELRDEIEFSSKVAGKSIRILKNLGSMAELLSHKVEEPGDPSSTYFLEDLFFRLIEGLEGGRRNED